MSVSGELIAYQPQGLSVFDRVGNPLEFIDKMGQVLAQGGVGGCKTESQGKMLMLACMLRNQDPFELTAEYDFIDGKLCRKSHMILAKFLELGGTITWVEDGDDGKVASAKFSFGTNVDRLIKFTIEEAHQARLIKADKPDSNWNKSPGAMLRARLITKAAKMICPQASAGYASREELDDGDDGSQPTVTPKVDNSPAAAKARAAKSQAQTGTTTATAAATGGDVIDAEFTKTEVKPEPKPEPEKVAPKAEAPKPEAAAVAAPATAHPDFDGTVTVQQIQEIDKLLAVLGTDRKTALDTPLQGKYGEGMVSTKMTSAFAESKLVKLRERVATKK